MHPRSIFVIELLLHEVVDLTAAGQLGVAARLGKESSQRRCPVDGTHHEPGLHRQSSAG